jgi:hypothetical protein
MHTYGGDDASWNCHVVYNSVGLEIMQPLIDVRLQALGTSSALGLRLLQPLSEAGELGRRIATAGEGVHAIRFAVDDLERGIATAQAAGLRLLARRGGPDERPEAEFDAADSWGMTIDLTERQRG